MDWIVAPGGGKTSGGRGSGEDRVLADVLPSLLGAMAVPGFDDALDLPPCRSAAALLVDGLGWSLLREHAEDAPLLAELATREPITVGFPTTTATSITSLGTGRPAGEHGIVGYTFAEPSGGLLHPLGWMRHGGGRRSLLADWPPEEAQPEPTVPQRAAEAGVSVSTVLPAEFDGTGLTRAGLRGGRFRGVRALGDLASEMLAAVREPAPALCYGYHGQLDMLGHLHGPGSQPWRMQLAQIDRLVRTLVEGLPDSALLAVVADHGMVRMDPGDALDFDRDPELRDGVRLLGGDVRARHVYVESGAEADVRAAWQEKLGSRGVVVPGARAIEDGWFGPVVRDPVRGRIGDLLAVSRDSGVLRSEVEPGESSLLGHHGSLTAAEQYVPLLLASG